MTPAELYELRMLLLALWWREDLEKVTKRFNELRGIAQ